MCDIAVFWYLTLFLPCHNTSPGYIRFRTGAALTLHNSSDILRTRQVHLNLYVLPLIQKSCSNNDNNNNNNNNHTFK